MTMNAAQKIKAARTQLVLFQPFWAHLLLRLEIEPRPPEWWKQRGLEPNIATNGKEIYYSPEFIEQQSLRRVEFFLAHEIGHIILNHATRREWREPRLYNEAADYMVNPLLRDSQFDVAPGSLMSSEFDGMFTEQAYAILEKRSPKQPKGGKGPGKGGGKGDKSNDGGDQQPGQVFDDCHSAAERAQLEQDWQVAVNQAAMTAKSAGNLPASLERLVDSFKNSKIDWVSVLRRFFEQTLPADMQWFPPSRRWVGEGVYLPSIKKESYGKIVLGVDTSGSIDQEMLRQFVSEINSIASEIHPTEMHVIYCDTQVGRHDIFQEHEPLTISAVGGGGTAFEPVFKYVEKEALNPKCLIYLTDLEGPLDFPEPEYPVLWTTQSKTLTGPWGETLVMPLEGEE